MSLQGQYVVTIIPTYNRANFLPDAIQSVLEQDFPFKKIIVVDDGSTDSTRELCMKFVAGHPDEFFYIYQNNSGCSSARNKGLDAIDGTAGFVCFLDSDDRFLAGKLSREVNLLTQYDKAEFTYSDAIVYDAISGKETLQTVAAAGAPEHFAIELFLTNAAKPGALLYRAALLKNIRFREDFLYNEDSDFLQKIAFQCMGVYSDQPGAWVRWHQGSKSRNFIEILKAVLRSNQESIELHPDFYLKNKSAIDGYMARNRYFLATEMLMAKRWQEALLYSDNAFLRVQSRLRFPYIYKARRIFNTWYNRQSK